jgi:hypothetical protein
VIRLATAGALFALAACQPEDSPIMRPGENCLRCHDGARARNWTLAGTVFPSSAAAADQGVEGVPVTVTDSRSRQLTLSTNGAGNFYTAEGLVPPFLVEIAYQGQGRTASMVQQQQSGACNACHTDPPQNGAPGRIYTP